MSSRKVIIVPSTVGLIKTTALYKIGQYFLKSYEYSSGKEQLHQICLVMQQKLI